MYRFFLISFMFLTCCDDDDNATRVFDEFYTPVINPENFTSTITHPFWPMLPERTWTFSGTDGEETETIHVNVLTETRIVMGVECAVVRDRVYVNGTMVEDTYDWYAQDDQGTVWYFGEDSREMDGETIVNYHGSWEAGVDGAQPGVVMWANPYPGQPYRQEYYYNEAEDWGQAIALLDSLTIGIGTFYDVVQTKEWNALEPDIIEHKFYASGIGLIKEQVVSGGSGLVELIEFTP